MSLIFSNYLLFRSSRFVSDLYQEWEGEDKEDDLFATSKVSVCDLSVVIYLCIYSLLFQTLPEQPSSTPSSLGSLVFSMTSP